MDKINELLEYLPKGAIESYFQEHSSHYYSCVKKLNLIRVDNEFKVAPDYDRNKFNEDDRLEMHCYSYGGDSLELKGRTDSLYLARVQNLDINLSTETLIDVIGKDKVESLLFEVRRWVFSIEGKGTLISLPHYEERTNIGRFALPEPL
jgi:hypothetical protein